MTIVQIVDAFNDGSLIKSFTLRSLRESGLSNEFKIGDTLIVVAEAEPASAYTLQIYLNSSMVFEEDGTFNGSVLDIRIPLVPPTFHAGSLYTVAFHAYAYNQPILGASSTDVATSYFTMVGVETKLKLEASYDHVFHSLYLHVNLTDVDGYPVANETVDFYMRRKNGRPRPTDGWVPIGSSQTNGSGIGLLTLAFNVFGGNYSIRACHKDNGDFGESENITDITVPYDAVSTSFLLNENQEAAHLNNAAPPQFPSYVKTDMELLKNWSFEVRDNASIHGGYPNDGVYECPPWSSNNGGWRNVRGDLDFDGDCDYVDARLFSNAYIGDYDWHADFDGDGDVDYADIRIFCDSYISDKPRHLDGLYSWYTSGGGDYQMWQWLDSDAIQAVAGQTVMFSFYFYPKSVVSDGSQNNARAEIYYEYSGGSNTAYGVLVCPSELKWWKAYVAATLPSTITAVKVIMHGKPDFKAWVDSASFSIWSGVTNLTVEVSSESPYAVLPITMNASCTVDAPLDALLMAFFLDHVNSTGFLGGGFCPVYEPGPPYLSKISFVWNPDVIGSHRVVVAVGLVTSVYDLIRLINGIGIIASEEVWLDFQRCPSNLVLYFPQAICGSTFAITAAFSRPRPYEAQVADLFSAYTLAPKMVYAGLDYVIDEGVESVPVKLFVYDYQGRLSIFQYPTNENGLAFFSVQLNFSDAYLTLSITAVFDDPDLLYDQSAVERNITFTKVAVNEAPTAGSEFFKLNYTVNKPYQDKEIYVGVDNPIDVEAGVFDLPVWNASVSTIVAKNITCFNATSGEAPITHGSDYLRVIEVYEPLSPSQRIKIRFDTGQEVYVDSRGCARIPSDATSLTVMKDNGAPIKANLEFLKITLDESLLTNNLGVAREMWKPGEVGTYLVQVKLPSNLSVVATFRSNVTQVNASVNLVRYFDVVKRPISLNVTYTPSQPIFETKITLFVYTFDEAAGNPAGNLRVDFYVWDIYMGYAYTNSSGIASFSFVPKDYDSPENPLFPDLMVQVFCLEDVYTQGAEEYIHIDTRYPTSLVSLDGDVINVPVGVERTFSFKLTRADNGSPVNGRFINFSIYGVDYATIFPGLTDSSGVVSFPWRSPKEGTYYINARSQARADWIYKQSNEVVVMVKAEVVPISVCFDVAPRGFEDGATLTLTANVSDATSGMPLNGCNVHFYAVDATGDRLPIGQDTTDESGVATLTWIYGLGPNAFIAEVSGAQVIATNPIQLIVAKETTLQLNVSRQETGTTHTISGRLLYGGDGVGSRLVKIFVNDTERATISTYWPNGEFGPAELDIPPVNNKPTTYQITALFEGDTPSNATAYATAPDGTRYPACTTIEYGYKPASNTTIVTVEPQSSEAVIPTKTPEEFQAEAKQKGWLKVWHQFTWWYPWYRLHFKFTMNNAKIDVGFNPVLPGGETVKYQGLENAFPAFSPEPGLTQEEIAHIAEEAVIEAALGILASSATAIVAANTRIPFATAIALGIYAGGLTAMIAYAWSLYSSGAQTKAKAFLIGLTANLWGVALATFMSFRSAFLTGMVATIIASAFSHLFDPTSLKVAVMAATAALYVSICVGIATLILVPEPSSITFKLTFPWISMLFAAIALNIVGAWG